MGMKYMMGDDQLQTVSDKTRDFLLNRLESEVHDLLKDDGGMVISQYDFQKIVLSLRKMKFFKVRGDGEMVIGDPDHLDD